MKHRHSERFHSPINISDKRPLPKRPIAPHKSKVFSFVRSAIIKPTASEKNARVLDYAITQTSSEVAPAKMWLRAVQKKTTSVPLKYRNKKDSRARKKAKGGPKYRDGWGAAHTGNHSSSRTGIGLKTFHNAPIFS